VGFKLGLVALLASSATAALTGGNRQYVVKVNGKMSGALGEELESHGVKITGYLGKGSMLVYGNEDAISRISSHERVKNVSKHSLDMKTKPMSKHTKDHARRLDEGDEKDFSRKLIVNLVNVDRTAEEVAAANTKLQGTVPDGTNVISVSPNRREIEFSATTKYADIRKSQLNLAGLSVVSTVETGVTFHTSNMGGSVLTKGNTLSTHPNLTGMNQLIGVADTGLEVDSCFFRDDNQTVAYGSGSMANFAHRKIVQYHPYADDLTEYAGHGSHVCGSIAGNSISGEFGDYDGMAPDAKVILIACFTSHYISN
jgi:hypothetical protein